MTVSSSSHFHSSILALSGFNSFFVFQKKMAEKESVNENFNQSLKVLAKKYPEIISSSFILFNFREENISSVTL